MEAVEQPLRLLAREGRDWFGVVITDGGGGTSSGASVTNELVEVTIVPEGVQATAQRQPGPRRGLAARLASGGGLNARNPGARAGPSIDLPACPRSKEHGLCNRVGCCRKYSARTLRRQLSVERPAITVLRRAVTGIGQAGGLLVAVCIAGLAVACTGAIGGNAQPASPDRSDVGQSEANPAGPTTPTSEPDLTSIDPCTLSDPGQLSSFGYTAVGDLSTDEPGRPSCVFDGVGAGFVSLITSISPELPYSYFAAPAANKTVTPVSTGPHESVSVLTLELPSNCLVAVRFRDDQVLIVQSNNSSNSAARNCEIALAVAATADAKIA